MTGDWCPVLAVADPFQALDWLAGLPGVTANHAAGFASCGTLRIRVTGPDAHLPGFRSLPFDHLALRVGDVDATLGALSQRSARLDPGFIIDGPREIAEFGPTGLRFAVVVGPSGARVELCAPRGLASRQAGCLGLDHLGLRTPDVGVASATILERGGTERARHRLIVSPRPVEVRFLVEGNLVWEVFDEAPHMPDVRGAARLGWVGVVAD